MLLLLMFPLNKYITRELRYFTLSLFDKFNTDIRDLSLLDNLNCGNTTHDMIVNVPYELWISLKWTLLKVWVNSCSSNLVSLNHLFSLRGCLRSKNQVIVASFDFFIIFSRHSLDRCQHQEISTIIEISLCLLQTPDYQKFWVFLHSHRCLSF